MDATTIFQRTRQLGHSQVEIALNASADWNVPQREAFYSLLSNLNSRSQERGRIDAEPHSKALLLVHSPASSGHEYDTPRAFHIDLSIGLERTCANMHNSPAVL